jgi:phage terminase large subunit GpA-like protein
MDDVDAKAGNTKAVENLKFMKGAQIGGTECGNNWIGYVIDKAPGPMLVVQPTVEMGKRWSKGRLAPLIEDSPSLRDKVKDPGTPATPCKARNSQVV